MWQNKSISARLPDLELQRGAYRLSENHRPILVALDGAPGAEQALPTALRLAKRWHAPLRLVQVRNPVESLHANMRLVEDQQSLSVEHRSAAYLNNLAERLRDAHQVSVQGELALGTSVADTLRSICGSDARALVMVRKQRSALSRFWWGSVSESLIGRLATPLLLVPDNYRMQERGDKQEEGFSRILVHLDGTSAAQRVLGNALALAAPAAVCHLLRVLPLAALSDPEQRGLGPANNPRNAAWQEMRQARNTLEARGISATTRLIFDGRKKGAAIIDEARATQAQMIVVAGCHYRLPWWLRNGVAEYVARHATIPALVAPADIPAGTELDDLDAIQQEAKYVDLRSN